MKFHAKFFDELTTKELYEIMRARSQIFVVEQGIKYCDFDRVDYDSLHCFLVDGDDVIGCLRAYRTEEYRDAVMLGRVLTLTHGCGYGQALMEKSLAAIKDRLSCDTLFIHSQKHAVGFYEIFGFRVISEEFIEAGIPHIAMKLENL